MVRQQRGSKKFVTFEIDGSRLYQNFDNHNFGYTMSETSPPCGLQISRCLCESPSGLLRYLNALKSHFSAINCRVNRNK